MTLQIKNLNSNTFLADYKADFLSDYRESSRLVINAYINKFLSFVYENPDDRIDQHLINRYVNLIRTTYQSNNTYNSIISYTKNFLNYIRVNNLKKDSIPELNFKIESVDPYENAKLMNLAQFKQILDFVRKKRSTTRGKKQLRFRRDYLIFIFLFTTGIRKNELMNLKFSDISLNNAQLYIKIRQKNSKTANKMLNAELYSDLKQLKILMGKGDQDYIFTPLFNQNKFSHTALNFLLNKYYKKLISDTGWVTVHSLRYLSGYEASKSYDQDSLIRTKKHLNHSNISTTMHYLSKMEELSNPDDSTMNVLYKKIITNQ